MLKSEPQKYINIKTAAHLAGVADSTIRYWCNKHRIGFQIEKHAAWRIDKTRLENLIAPRDGARD